jgi:hypothetical protein
MAEVKESMGAIEEYIPPTQDGEDETPDEMPVAQPVVEQKPLPIVEPKPEPVANTCVACNTVQPEGAKFCNNCGNTMAPLKTGTADFIQKLPGTQQTAEPINPFIDGTMVNTGGATPATTTGVQATGRKFTQALRTGLPNIGMDVGTMKSILAEVYKRMHEHMFKKCGYQVCGAGTGVNEGFNPAMLGNILQPISIADIPRATELIVGYDKYDSTTGKTQMRVACADGLIAGKVSKSNKMPFYAIYINNNGTEQKRILMAQNPWKQNTNGYSKTALEAQQGNQISWVWDAADGQKYRTWFHKIKNGIQEWL